jgi:hypothetical protein
MLYTIIIALTFLTAHTTHSMTTEPHSQFTIKSFTGQEAERYIDGIIAIRTNMFKEYPYLYKGTVEIEKEYLQIYFKSSHATILLAFDSDDNVIGFSSSIPLNDEAEEIKAPFIEKQLNCDDYLYIGEGLIYPEYQGKNLVRQAAQIHEEIARSKGYKYLTFMAVNRPENHPCKPDNYRSTDDLFKHFGCTKFDNMNVTLTWDQVDTNEQTTNTLSLWYKELRSINETH